MATYSVFTFAGTVSFVNLPGNPDYPGDVTPPNPPDQAVKGYLVVETKTGTIVTFSFGEFGLGSVKPDGEFFKWDGTYQNGFLQALPGPTFANCQGASLSVRSEDMRSGIPGDRVTKSYSGFATLLVSFDTP